VRTAGDTRNPTVLLLHGIGRSLEDWDLQFPLLARRWRVVALDLPGFGFSERRPEPASLEGFARGVLETMDELGQEGPFHVVGNSLGGAVAQKILAMEPDRVTSLVLVNSAGFGSEVALPLRIVALRGVGPALLKRTSAKGVRSSEAMIFADPRLATPERVDHALAIAERSDPSATMHEAARALATVRGVRPEWRSALLHDTAAHRRPTLIVWGDRDRILPAKHMSAAAQAYPHARRHVFDGIGHMPQIECPDAFAEQVETFLVAQSETGLTQSRG
jgi:pimeloyl-ACP methyl ester carboxylesterase